MILKKDTIYSLLGLLIGLMVLSILVLLYRQQKEELLRQQEQAKIDQAKQKEEEKQEEERRNILKNAETKDIPVKEGDTPNKAKLYLDITTPSHEETSTQSFIYIAGKTLPNSLIEVNDVYTALTLDGSFFYKYELLQGSNEIIVTASDFNGESITSELLVYYSKSKEKPRDRFYETARVSSVEGGTVDIILNKDAGNYTVKSNSSTRIYTKYGYKTPISSINKGDEIVITGTKSEDTARTINAQTIRNRSNLKKANVFWGEISGLKPKSTYTVSLCNNISKDLILSTDVSVKASDTTDLKVSNLKVGTLAVFKGDTAITQVFTLKDLSCPRAAAL